ncbi:MAG: tRNA pseudouridine(38-40) synthase TruA [Gemmatimonadetes bacterium]|nr:tRNA pseudouridine(38-40) synthase TruA [Gemmatimonadota bacterium]
MSVRTVQLVLHYDGSAFSGWQVQPQRRTVQGELERVLAELCGERIVAQGAGRTDAGVHARGQAVGVRVPVRWQAQGLRRAVNALLPDDVWVAAAHDMRPEFHARHSATSRRYRYVIGTDDGTRSPFRRRWEWFVSRPLDLDVLHTLSGMILGSHRFLAFAVRGTAPAGDEHRCDVSLARWEREGTRLTFHVEANRFLHHMVRFLVGTMVDVAAGRRPLAHFGPLLAAPSNDEVSPPAPAHALSLEAVQYPADLYLA